MLPNKFGFIGIVPLADLYNGSLNHAISIGIVSYLSVSTPVLANN